MAKPAQRSEKAERISSPVTLRDGTTILDIDHYAPFLLNAVSNAWLRLTSARYRDEFGLGIVEWRVLSMLNIEPGISANRICDVVRLDKSAVSKSLSILDDSGYLRFESNPTDPRKRRWWLSERGLETHERILGIALDYEAKLVDEVPAQDLDTFLRVMRQMLHNLDEKI
ncbi:MarR family winged helix-turn-helix transcriptional regulator [Paracoccus aestuariivivens]|uniref:MarR family transcriptional regulator n=1 Tax=Paracoccus aestuariivivens TaxID=1820333 RepID=A0A6L6JBN3_9RHOB|nr:MarR family winged helix-turn-helix transcriptional regulator [Paracoccus aestuariivivens]MTH79613.1 MarR family transcriptional regulator [Paracoccus aestuariivivens]